jgi:hypothetical protein
MEARRSRFRRWDKEFRQDNRIYRMARKEIRGAVFSPVRGVSYRDRTGKAF